jgi:hypothetical protein
MEYLTKSMRLDSEVIAWLDDLRKAHGSYNKGLRVLAFAVRAGADKISPPVLDGLINQGRGNQDPEVPLSRQIEVQLVPLTNGIKHIDYSKAKDR